MPVRMQLHSATKLAALAMAVAATACDAPLSDPEPIYPFRISKERVAVLGRHGPGVGPGPLVRDGAGFFYHSNDYNRGVVSVYDVHGVHRLDLTRRGLGPAEAMQAGSLQVSSTDSLFVYDSRMHREIVFGPDRSHVRTRSQLPPFQRVLRLEDGYLILQTGWAAHRRGDGRVEPLTVLGPDGQMVSEFGFDDSYDGVRMDRVVAKSRIEGELWTARPSRPTIQRWSLDGDLRATLEPDLPWFEPHSFGPVIPRRPPRPYIWGMQEDDEGRLWLLVGVADERAVAEWRDVPGGDPDMGFSGDLNRYYDTVLLVLEPETAAILASHRVDELLRFSGTGEVYWNYITPAGIPMIEVWRLALGRW